VPLGEPADHVQSHVPGHPGVDDRVASQPRVDVGQLIGRDPDSGVLDTDHHRAVAGAFGADDDRGTLRRLRRRVLQQLGQNVAQVVRGHPQHLDVRQRRDLGPAVVGDLRDRGPGHVQQRDRL
jgi:hypothetical protein